MNNIAFDAPILQAVRKVYLPQDAADPLAWYIDHLEHNLDHYDPHSIITVFACAGFDAIPIDLLVAHNAVEEAANTLREATEDFLKKLEAIAAAKANQATA
jgi:hypothetical protein